MQAISTLLDKLKKRDPHLDEHLSGIYNTVPFHNLIRLLELFAERFPGHSSVSVLRAPGRVNLIGEHTDYNGLPVMPMATDRDILVAFAPRDDGVVRIHNPHYEPKTFEIAETIQPYETGDWGNYVKAGVQRITRLALEDAGHGSSGVNEKNLSASSPNNATLNDAPLRGFDACFLGSIPIGAGLSRRSAMVVASAMVFLETNRLSLDPLLFAELMAEAEWYVGTQGGGMDQAACILSRKEKALRIDFFPLRVQPVSLSKDYSIVVADSLVTASKTKETRLQYNTRPAECRAATALTANHLHQTEGIAVMDMQRLGDIYLRIGVENSLRLLEATFTKERYSKTELAFILGLTEKEIDALFFTTKSGDLIPAPEDGFPLKARARHVFTEALRVEESVAALEKKDVETFGTKLNGSWQSCRDDYEIGHPAIDDIISIALDAGSTGSRLTGAGFGGCTIHLVGNDRVESFIETLKREYYEKEIQKYPQAAVRLKEMPPHNRENILFTASPSAGASLLF